jgi:hypothetical protein
MKAFIGKRELTFVTATVRNGGVSKREGYVLIVV